jgi:hypothetical protein
VRVSAVDREMRNALAIGVGVLIGLILAAIVCTGLLSPVRD